MVGYAPRYIRSDLSVSLQNSRAYDVKASASMSRTFLPCCARLTPRSTAVGGSCQHRLSDRSKRSRDILKNVLAILTWVRPPFA